MSSRLKQYVWGAAILAIAMVFVMQFRPGSQLQGMGGPAPGPTCAVENDGRCIVSQSDWVTAMRLASSAALDSDDARDQLRALVIEGLIQRWLLIEDAERLGIRVSDDEVTRELSKGLARVSLPVDIESGMFSYKLGLTQPPEGPARAMGVSDPKTNKFDYERYKKWVQRVSNKTLKDFREYAATEELAARMRGIVKARVRVSEQEAYGEFTQNSAKISVDYIELSNEWYQRHADASSEAVGKWAEANAKELDEAWGEKKDDFAPECRKARHILARIDDAASDKEAAKKKARAKLDAAKQRIDKGDDFATVAREMSEDAQSAPHGGELGCFAAGKLAKPNTAKAVDDAAFALEKGKMSGPLESSFGLHLVKVDDVLKGEAAEKEGKALVAREHYLKAEGDRQAAEAAKQILAAVKGGKTLQQALDDQLASMLAPTSDKGDKDKGDKEQGKPKKDDKPQGDAERPKIATSKEFNVAGPPMQGAENPAGAARACFAVEKPGSPCSDVIKLYDGYAVAVLKEKLPIDPKEWETQRALIMAAMRDEKQRDALISYVHELRAKYAKAITYKIPLHEEREDKKGGKGKKEAPAPPPEMPPLDE